MSQEIEQLNAAIAALQAQRELIGPALTEAALAPLLARLEEVAAASGACDAAKAAGQSRRQVTVLFLDIVGSTNLSEGLDPEDVHSIMDEALEQFTRIVGAHGGRVLKYAGDSLLAVFGAEEVREDDAERAVSAGLDLLVEGQHQGQLVTDRFARSGFAVRIGLHTGGVLLGGGVDAQSSVRGFTVNVAARMEQTAPPGALRISHDTYRQVRGVFDVLPQPPLKVKGVSLPMTTYLVLRRKPRAFRVATRGIDGVETRMVGRDAELEQLQAAFKRLYTQRRLSVITVVADAGLGKSRLLYEFENWAEARPEAFYFFHGRAHPLTQSQPYGLLRDILARRFQIADGETMLRAKQQFEQGIVPLFLADDGAEMAQAHAHLLGHLVGLDFSESRHIQGIQDDAKQIRNRGFHTAAQVFRRVCAEDRAPVLLLIDDLNWADNGSLDFLNYLVQVNRDLPMLILTLTRPTLLHRRTNLPNMPETQFITLHPLDRSSSRLLANELLKKLPEIPAALRELVTGGADGNPFYMEELVKMLVDEGAILTHLDVWQVNPQRLLGMRIPPTLTGVLQARLDALQPAEKLALQHASVIGMVFWDQALAALQASAPTMLPALLKHELIVAHDGTLLDEGGQAPREFAFAHQVLHQVTYDTLLKRTRGELHAKVASWLASQSGIRAKDFLGAIAQHFVKAGDLEQACEYFARAAEHAAGRYAHEAVTDLVAKGMALPDQGTEPNRNLSPTGHGRRMQHWRLLDVRERTLDLQGRRIEQQADIDALQALADALDDDHWRAEVAWRRSTIAMRTGDYSAMERAARDACAMAERAADSILELRGKHRLALALTYLGDGVAGRQIAQQGLARSRSTGSRQLEALFLNALSFIADSQADRLASLDLDQQDLLINRELGNRRNEAIALGNLGSGWLRLGEHTQAGRHLHESLQLARTVGDLATQPNALTNLSVLALRQGDEALALSHARTALDISIMVQSPEFEAIAQCSLGNAELALGRYRAATAAFGRAHAISAVLGNATRYDALAGLARAAAAENNIAVAMRTVEELLAPGHPSADLDAAEMPHLIRWTCHQVLEQAGDPRAGAALESAHAKLLNAAATIGDNALRESFLHNIPEHQAIMSARQRH